MKILVTGAAGFIGYHLVKVLASRGDQIIGLDNINDYYDVNLKYGRLADSGISQDDIKYGQKVNSSKYDNYSFLKLNLEDREGIEKVFREESFDAVCNLAAQAGVRYSLDNPYAYIESNILGFTNLLEGCRNNKVKHFVFASSSSVYGLNETMPFKTADNVDHPISLYAASKKANELMSHTYSHLYNIPITGLRFFTVYGPWGRPDMAYFKFTNAILEGKAIDVYNNGNMSRDFTYIDDIVEGVVKVIDSPPKGNENWNGENPDPSSSKCPYMIYNIGNNEPVKLMDFIKAIENSLGMEAEMNFLPMQPGDVPATYADVTGLMRDMHYKPDTQVPDGIERFVKWYKEYYNVQL